MGLHKAVFSAYLRAAFPGNLFHQDISLHCCIWILLWELEVSHISIHSTTLLCYAIFSRKLLQFFAFVCAWTPPPVFLQTLWGDPSQLCSERLCSLLTLLTRVTLVLSSATSSLPILAHCP